LKNPNILVVMVDQMRLPAWLTNLGPNQSLAATIPNITGLQNSAYNFGEYFVAATMCTPSRATLLTGLYAPQTGVYVNGDGGVGVGPSLNPAFPTWGEAVATLSPAYKGNVWWFGKWHLSQNLNSAPLAPYGFNTRLIPGGPSAPYNYSPDGQRNEGTDGGITDGESWSSDAMIANDFIGWLQGQAPTVGAPGTPWCATVSLLNPHDIAWAPDWLENSPFPPQGIPVPPLYFSPPSGSLTPPNFYAGTPNPWNQENLATVPNKPGLQYAYQQQLNAEVGTVSDWKLFLNQYFWLQNLVDQQVGRVLAALNSSPFASNTIIIFTCDHGEYAGSHGLHGKGFAAYDESLRVPFSVQFPGQAGAIAMNQMCSAVDFFGFICDLATGGSGQWRLLYPDLANRQSIWSFLYANSGETRIAGLGAGGTALPYILHTFDDSQLAKPHITCLRTKNDPANGFVGAKLAFYWVWTSCTTYPNSTPPDPEFYDYNPQTTGNTSELGNDYFSTNPVTQGTISQYTQVLGNWGPPSTGIIGSELNARLVGKGTDGNPLTQAQSKARLAYYTYISGNGTCPGS
jgi:arylsulfatase A-like enzyme